MTKRKKVKIESYKKVFDGAVFEIYRAKGVFPSGKTGEFEYAKRAPYVGVFAFDKNKKLLLTNEYRPKLGKVIWRIPIGSIEENETPKNAAQRELREETNFRAGKMRLFMKNTRSETFVYNAYLYVANDLKVDPLSFDDGEDIVIIPTPLKKAYEMAVEGGILSDFISLGIIRLYSQIQKKGFENFFKKNGA